MIFGPILVKLWRQVGQVDDGFIAEEHRSFDDVFEFADIAGPIMLP